jgi:formylglycine-generating enzyme
VRRRALICGLSGLGLVWAQAHAEPLQKSEPIGRPGRRCPPEMVQVAGYCVDRWEAVMVDDESGNPLSPYYPPEPKKARWVSQIWQVERLSTGDAAARRMPLPELSEWQKTHVYKPRAVSRAGAVPQGYLSYFTAKAACESAGKRLCTEGEWMTACRGDRARRFPYGDQFVRGKCNIYRLLHPAAILHGDSSVGHRDPRLHLLLEAGKNPLLAATGSYAECKSTWGNDAIYDMVGNIDEWVESERGLFLGGFYARSSTKGCETRVGNHARIYYDYSIGTRCCKGLDQAEPAAPSTR